jgi:hypothetical protein
MTPEALFRLPESIADPARSFRLYGATAALISDVCSFFKSCPAFFADIVDGEFSEGIDQPPHDPVPCAIDFHNKGI